MFLADPTPYQSDDLNPMITHAEIKPSTNKSSGGPIANGTVLTSFSHIGDGCETI